VPEEYFCEGRALDFLERLTVMTLFQAELLYTQGRFEAGVGLLVDERGGIVALQNDGGDLPEDTRVVRMPGKALLPGFVNVHSHSFQRLLRGRTESRRSGGRDFWSWRGAMYHAAASLSPEQVYHVARMAFLEMALAGTTTVGEFHYVHRTPEGAAYGDANLLAHQVIAAAESVGIRIALLRTAYQRAGFELPPDPGQTRFLESTEEYLAHVDALRRRYSSTEAWVGVAPHSVRAVPVDEIEKMAEYAKEHDLPLHMHVSEQTAEVEACRREYDRTPVRLLAERGILDERFTAVHAIHIDGEEMDLLAARGATICSCPTTERNLGDGIFPAREVVNRGIPIGFGSDSQAQIDPLEDARELEYHLRLQQQQRSLLDGIDGQELSARLLRCATAYGAASLGCAAGELEAGRLADFFTVDLEDVSVAGSSAEDLPAMIVFGLQRSAICDVAVGGRLVVRDHRHLQQEEILKNYQEVAGKVWDVPQLAAK
jgi:formimidoylglutamate deiminase